MPRTLIQVPASARRGDIIEVRVTIAHPMETGFRPGAAGLAGMAASARAMQRDDDQNPATLWVQEGEQLWARAPSSSAQSCAGCHGPATRMRGVATRYPAWDEPLRRPVDLATRINLCRE